MPTTIEWTNETWNPVTGCTPVSEGCHHCYARRMAHRLAGRYGYPREPHEFDVTLRPERLEQPLHWRKPRMIFVCSMSDLFHNDVPPSFICEIWQVMRECPQHTFQILTKRAQRMFEIVTTYIADDALGFAPLPNVWGLVTAENQATADKRIPWLLRTPFAVRGVSCEPLLGEIDLHLEHTPPCSHPGCYSHISHPCEGCGRIGGRLPLDWVICGGESGPGARPMHPDWARSLRDQCQAADVPFFFKQWGAWAPIQDIDTYKWKWALNHNTQRTVVSAYGLLGIKDKLVYRVGKKRAGHLLDGREHHEFPRISVDTVPDP